MTDELFLLLDENTKELMNEAYGGFSAETMTNPERLFDTITEIVSENAQSPLNALIMLIGIIIAVAVASNFSTKNDMTPTVEFIISLMVSSVLIIPVASFVQRVSTVIENSQVFLSAYAPVYAAVTVSSGSPATAASYCTLTVAASEISGYVITKVLLPLVGMFAGIALVAGMSDVFKLDKISTGAEKLIKTLVCIISTVFVGILSIKTIIAACGDSVAYRSAKYVVSGFVPIAGGILGESLTAVFSCMKYIKGTVGAFGIIAGGFIFLPIVTECILWQACVGVSGFVAEVFDVKPAGRILNTASSMIGIVMYLLLFMIMLLIVTTAAILIVGGI